MANEQKPPVDPADFWDLSDLVPPRPPKRQIAQGRGADVSAVDVGASAPRHVYTSAGRSPVVDVPLTERSISLTPPPVPAEPQAKYEPTSPLLFEVRLYPFAGATAYYERFLAAARQLSGREGHPCPIAVFYTYMPQYAQLSPAAQDTYLWWRTCFRRGEAIAVPYPYLLLFVYETLNLDDDARQAQADLTRLWLSYRGAYPALDGTLREWICDHALIHRLPPPVLPEGQTDALLAGCRLKEFFIAAAGERDMTAALLRFCNNYDYKKSKFYPPAAPLFDRVMADAVRVALQHRGWQNGMPPASHESGTQRREAYSGAFCSPAVRRVIEVDYLSFSHTHTLRFLISDVLKYAENAIRAARGVKSRLTVYEIDVPLRRKLDEYFAGALPPRTAPKASAPSETPAYERRYDLPVTAFSPARAAAIEAASWDTTKRLVEAFTPETVAENAPPAPPTPAETPAPAGGAAALAPFAAFLAACDPPDRAAQRAFAMEKATMPDAVADEINAVAAATFGDVILEETEHGYAVIADYRDELHEKGVL